MDYISEYKSPLGKLVMASDGKAIVGLWFEEQKYFLAGISNTVTKKNLEIFDVAKEWLDIYFQGQIPNFTPELNMRTTDFRKRVWQIMLDIPYGKTMTYGQIAKIIAKERKIDNMSPQAVGGAVGHNAISLIIPCHRVVGSDGSLTGYAGGIDRKEALHRLEGITCGSTGVFDTCFSSKK